MTDSNPFRAEHQRMQQEARSGIALLERAALVAREQGEFSPRTDAFLGFLGLIAIKAMAASPLDLAGLLDEIARMARK